MTGDEKIKILWVIAASIVGGFFLGLLTHRWLTASPLPIETFDWILAHGDRGLALVGLFLVGSWALFVQRQARGDVAAERAARTTEVDRIRAECSFELREERRRNTALEERYALKVEALMRETRPALTRVADVLSMIAGDESSPDDSPGTGTESPHEED